MGVFKCQDGVMFNIIPPETDKRHLGSWILRKFSKSRLQRGVRGSTSRRSFSKWIWATTWLGHSKLE